MKRLAILFILVHFLSCSSKPEKQLQNNVAENRYDSLISRINHLEEIIDSISKINMQPNHDSWFSNNVEGKKLTELGIDDPEQFIKDALRQKPELIPIKPVLGGNMHFNRIQLLGKKWIIARYEDGHVSGRSLFSYSINNDSISFEIIASD